MFYGSESLSSLKGADPYRERPATVLGTDDERGILHAIFEVVTNSTDEVSEGYGKEVILNVFQDGSVEVKDFGRGVPMGWNSIEKKYAWEIVFCTMYGSGKFDSSNYKKSAGLNGIGDTAAQFTSEYMDVTSVRDEIKNRTVDKKGNEHLELHRVRYEMHFKKGYPVGELKEEIVDSTIPTGTTIKFKPDIEVFKGAESIRIPVEQYVTKLRQKAMISAGVKFVLNYFGRDPIVLIYKGGIKEYLDQVIKSKVTSNFIEVGTEGLGQDRENGETYKAYCDVVFSFSKDSPIFECYHNQEELGLGGSSSDAFRASVVKFFNAYGKLAKDDRLIWKDFADITTCVLSTFCPGHLTSWLGQTKDAINNKFIGELVKDSVYRALENYALSDNEGIKSALELAKANKEAREKLERFKKNTIRELTRSTDGYRTAPNKLTRCTGKDKSKNELYIVEGDSAKGPVCLSRDSVTQAVLASRGKILNCQKATFEKIISSDEIQNFIRSLGCGIERRVEGLEDLPEFDINKLNYDKIIICCDADFDGKHIITLYLTCIWYLMPTLIKEGKVYVVEPPLYAISHGKKDRVYAYNKVELDRELAKLEESGVGKNKISIKRMKGLGESNASEMSIAIMDKDTRRLINVEYPKNEERFNILIESLMGNSVEDRRDIIDVYFDTEFDELAFSDSDSLGDLVARESILGF